MKINTEGPIDMYSERLSSFFWRASPDILVPGVFVTCSPLIISLLSEGVIHDSTLFTGKLLKINTTMPFLSHMNKYH